MLTNVALILLALYLLFRGYVWIIRRLDEANAQLRDPHGYTQHRPMTPRERSFHDVQARDGTRGR